MWDHMDLTVLAVEHYSSKDHSPIKTVGSLTRTMSGSSVSSEPKPAGFQSGGAFQAAVNFLLRRGANTQRA